MRSKLCITTIFLVFLVSLLHVGFTSAELKLYKHRIDVPLLIMDSPDFNSSTIVFNIFIDVEVYNNITTRGPIVFIEDFLFRANFSTSSLNLIEYNEKEILYNITDNDIQYFLPQQNFTELTNESLLFRQFVLLYTLDNSTFLQGSVLLEYYSGFYTTDPNVPQDSVTPNSIDLLLGGNHNSQDDGIENENSSETTTTIYHIVLPVVLGVAVLVIIAIVIVAAIFAARKKSKIRSILAGSSSGSE